ncbi:ISL3 family transposase [Ferrimonas balearica]|uniref:ISL3 family transposase n=1 Tax=Ferrimonas balearica TaxID=44012 RepID=UPI001C5ACFDC|nr:ISL3 family transposase [Ferrimonas balearica]MBW3166251.1 ISL3 family transposase [Ferrimonas balearica]
MSQLTLPVELWEGFTPSHVEQSHDALIIQLVPTRRPICPCGLVAQHIHDTNLRTVTDRALFEHAVTLRVPVRRLVCSQCGIRTEHITWLSPFSRLTERLIRLVESLLKVLPVKHVASLVGLHWHTIKTLDKRRLNREVVEPDWSQVRRLVMDEFALFKGHRYATVIADADTHQVLWLAEGRSRAAIRPFFERLGQQCHRIEAVAMDMNTAFDLEVQEHCPNARVIYDLFHVVAKYGREVIDRVRVDCANELRGDKPARRHVKRGRWVLLKNHENMNDRERSYLDELLAANHSLMVVYLLKEELKALWYCRDEESAIKRWQLWWQQVHESGLKPLIQLAQKLKPYLSGITASALYPLHTCRLEGMNNKIKLIKRMAYGYRDTEYFFLKIKAAFPGDLR